MTSQTEKKEINNFRILIIDDNKNIHDDFNKIFKQATTNSKEKELENILFENDTQKTNNITQDILTIDHALSGEEGIQLVKRSVENNTPYSAVIIDIRMPDGIDGVTTTMKIFEFEKNIQVIFCSAFSDYKWDEMQSMLKHKDRWVILKKPFDLIEIRQMTLSLCNKWQLLISMQEKIDKQTKTLEKKIEELTKAKEEIKHLAYYDSLTGLPNRFFFQQLLKQCMCDADKNKTSMHLLFLDLDGFKKINDIYGHAVGDQLLKEVANRLKKFLRKTDVISHFTKDQDPTISSRLAGDEFTVIIQHIKSKDDLLKIINRLHEVLIAAYEIDEKTLNVTVSIGAASYPDDVKLADELIQGADLAMYQSKKNGKNEISFYNKDVNSLVTKNYQIELDIASSLENNDFYLVYQPKASIQDESIIGAEALIRWNHPEHGLLLPGDFIPIAEDTNIITKIDEYVLNMVCKQIIEWKNANLIKNFTISVNVSPVFFQMEDFVEKINDILAKYNLPAKYLELEVTENYLIKPKEKIINVLNNLRSLSGGGIRLSIDDFGVGYSSLSYLTQFPIDTIKIDRSFINKVTLNKNNKSIVEAIINLSHGLSCNVIAEGVENREQFNILKELKCDAFQGLLFCEPLIPNKFIDLLTKELIK